mmetsp:Transcript_19474/g.61946  ORF Transcript_19474/g.61946 Transcript_19474/m.61946 type:complete len:1049 (-) Transcript_19474:51-3197(-)
MAAPPTRPPRPMDSTGEREIEGNVDLQRGGMSVEDYVGRIGGQSASSAADHEHFSDFKRASLSGARARLPRLSCKAWLVANLKSGEVLAHHNAMHERQIASITKLVTAWIVAQVVDAVPALRSARVRVSAQAAGVTGTSAQLREGETYTVLELLHGMLLPSGNDAATALAEFFGPLFAPRSVLLKPGPPSPATQLSPKLPIDAVPVHSVAAPPSPLPLAFPEAAEAPVRGACCPAAMQLDASPPGAKPSPCSSPATWVLSDEEGEEEKGAGGEGEASKAAMRFSGGAEEEEEAELGPGCVTSHHSAALLGSRTSVESAGSPHLAGSGVAPQIRHASDPHRRAVASKWPAASPLGVRESTPCDAEEGVMSDDGRSRHSASPAGSVATAPAPARSTRRRGGSDPPLVSSAKRIAGRWAPRGGAGSGGSPRAAAAAVGLGRAAAHLPALRPSSQLQPLSPTTLTPGPRASAFWGESSERPAWSLRTPQHRPASAVGMSRDRGAGQCTDLGGTPNGRAWAASPGVSASAGIGADGSAAEGDDRSVASESTMAASCTLSAAHALVTMGWEGLPATAPRSMPSTWQGRGRRDRRRGCASSSSLSSSSRPQLAPITEGAGPAAADEAAWPPVGMVSDVEGARAGAAAMETWGTDASCAWFVSRMNEEARRLGMLHTHFVNPHGLAEDGHCSCAADVARLAVRVWRHPLLRRVCGTKRLQCRIPWSKGLPLAGYPRQLEWRNSNNLLWRSGSGCVYSGIKTGITPAAMGCLVTALRRTVRANSTALMIVVLGSAGAQERFVDTDRLAQWAMEAIPDRTTIHQLSAERRRGRRNRSSTQRREVASATPSNEPGDGSWRGRPSTVSPRAHAGRHRARTRRVSRVSASPGVGQGSVRSVPPPAASAAEGHPNVGASSCSPATLSAPKLHAPRAAEQVGGRAGVSSTRQLPTLALSPVQPPAPALPAGSGVVFRTGGRIACGDVLGPALGAVRLSMSHTAIADAERGPTRPDLIARDGASPGDAGPSAHGGDSGVTVWELQSSPSAAALPVVERGGECKE